MSVENQDNQKIEKMGNKIDEKESGHKKTESRQEKWKRIANEIEKTADVQGYEIDENIKDVVIRPVA